MKPRPSLVLLAALLVPACEQDAPSDGDIDCSTAVVPRFTEMTVWAKCTTCHSSKLDENSRSGATFGIDFDTYKDARANAQPAMDAVADGSMPVGAELTDDERQQLYTWASCDAPN